MFAVGDPVESVLPSTRRYVFPNDVIVSPSASRTKYEPGMISSDPGVKWIWICLLMIARSFADGALDASAVSCTFWPGYADASAARKRVSAQSFAETARVTSPFFRQITNAVSN